MDSKDVPLKFTFCQKPLGTSILLQFKETLSIFPPSSLESLLVSFHLENLTLRNEETIATLRLKLIFSYI